MYALFSENSPAGTFRPYIGVARVESVFNVFLPKFVSRNGFKYFSCCVYKLWNVINFCCLYEIVRLIVSNDTARNLSYKVLSVKLVGYSLTAKMFSIHLLCPKEYLKNNSEYKVERGIEEVGYIRDSVLLLRNFQKTRKTM